MELKSTDLNIDINCISSFNRTFMELKLCMTDDVSDVTLF